MPGRQVVLGIGLLDRLQRALEVVERGQQLARELADPARLGRADLARHPLAVVVEVRLGALGELEVRVGLARPLEQVGLVDGLGDAVARGLGVGAGRRVVAELGLGNDRLGLGDDRLGLGRFAVARRAAAAPRRAPPLRAPSPPLAPARTRASAPRPPSRRARPRPRRRRRRRRRTRSARRGRRRCRRTPPAAPRPSRTSPRRSCGTPTAAPRPSR